MIRNILCYRNNKVVLKIDCFISKGALKVMLKNKILFYRSNNGSMDLVFLDNFDRVVIDNDIWEDFMEVLNNEEKEN